MSSISNDAPKGSGHGLREADLNTDPIVQFGLWYDQVLAAGVPEPNAMTLATSTTDGVPSARIVLLKGYDARGFTFFTNYESQKGRELAENPRVALVMFWPTLERQVRITGTASRTGRDESEAYFRGRPVGSQIGAWASSQSTVLIDREELDARAQMLAQQFHGKPVPLPAYWGGFRVQPNAVEFWQARVSRLHDRFRYTRLATQEWRRERLSP